jgi:hypothetical protein
MSIAGARGVLVHQIVEWSRRPVSLEEARAEIRFLDRAMAAEAMPIGRLTNELDPASVRHPRCGLPNRRVSGMFVEAGQLS